MFHDHAKQRVWGVGFGGWALGFSRHDSGPEWYLYECRCKSCYMGGCQNYGPFLGPYYNTAPNI